MVPPPESEKTLVIGSAVSAFGERGAALHAKEAAAAYVLLNLHFVWGTSSSYADMGGIADLCSEDPHDRFGPINC